MNFIHTYWPYFVIAFSAILVLFLACSLPGWIRRSRLKKQGRVGEAKVASILKNYALAHGCKVINDISIPLYDSCTQIDHLLVGPCGILVVETKSHKGDIYAEPRAKEWVQVIGGKRETMYNPLFQNKTHVDALRYQLQKNKIYKIPVDSIVVFSGANKKNLYIEKGHPVVDIRYLKQFLNRSNFLMRDAGVDTEQLVSFLKSIQITDAKTLKKHDQDVRKHSR